MATKPSVAENPKTPTFEDRVRHTHPKNRPQYCCTDKLGVHRGANHSSNTEMKSPVFWKTSKLNGIRATLMLQPRITKIGTTKSAISTSSSHGGGHGGGHGDPQARQVTNDRCQARKPFLSCLALRSQRLLENGTVALAPQQVAQPMEAPLRTWRTATTFMYLVRTLGALPPL